jgi:hypothetical protein
MPRNYTDSIKGRTLEANRPDPVRYNVAASPVDTYVAPKTSNNALRLAEALSTVNTRLTPIVEEKLAKEAEARNSQGVLDRTQGKDKEKDAGEAYVNGFMSMDGALKGSDDFSLLHQKYLTEFDKENGDIVQFIREFHQGQTKGLDDPAFLKQYTNTFANGTAKLLDDHAQYKKGMEVQKVESHSMDIITGMVKSYADNGMPVDDGAVDNMRQFLNKDMGVSNSRFNDLLFGSIKRLGDGGNFAVYDMLKKARPDGTPGMYNIPEWREKIDAAQIHAQNVFLRNKADAEKAAAQAREDEVDRQMLEVFLEPDMKKASVMFSGLIRSGMIDKATDAITWRKHLEEYTDGRPSIDQQENEVSILTGIYRRGVKPRDILNANVTLSQRRYLLGELEQAKRADEANGASGSGIFKTPEYKMGEDYVDNMLKSTPTPTDIMGVGSQFEREQRATAKLRFAREAQNVGSPSELHDLRERIVKDALEIRKTVGGFSNPPTPHLGQMRYSTPQELMENRKNMSNEEYLRNIEALEARVRNQ